MQYYLNPESMYISPIYLFCLNSQSSRFNQRQRYALLSVFNKTIFNIIYDKKYEKLSSESYVENPSAIQLNRFFSP